MSLQRRNWISYMFVAGLLLTISHTGLFAQETVVQLRRNVLHDSSEREKGKSFYVSDPLFTELGRQAFLITAREEFGLTTRDSSLYEQVDRESPKTFDAVLRVQTAQGAEGQPKGADMQISRGPKQLWESKLTDEDYPVKAYQKICEELEPLIRGKFVELLAAEGFKPTPSKIVATGDLTDSQKTLVEEMNHLSQWKFLRELHKDIRTKGESPERLGGLVRGYGNLAQLTLPLLDLRHQVYRARALLYAERLVHRLEGSRRSLYFRQYAWVMSGMILPSTELIEGFEGEAEAGQTPTWAPILADYGYYKYPDLEKRAFEGKSPHRELAATLWFRAIQQSYSKNLTINAGKRANKEKLRSLWIVDAMFEQAGVSMNHKVTAAGPRLHSHQLVTRLQNTLEVSEETKTVLEQLSSQRGEYTVHAIADVAEALIKEGENDTREPSIANLGHTIDGWNVLHVTRQLMFYRNYLGVDASEEAKAVSIALRNHPLQNLVMALALPRTARLREYESLLATTEFIDADTRTAYRMCSCVPDQVNFANMTAKDVRVRTYGAQSNVEQEMAHYLSLDRNSESDPQHNAWRLICCSWHAPLRIATKVETDFEEILAESPHWEKQFAHIPPVTLEFARGYARADKTEKSIEVYNRYLDIEPELKIFRELATVYYKNKDDENWLKTMKRVFEFEDFGLEHSFAANSIGATYLREQKPKDALPWCEQGAQSGAAIPMQNLCQCLTLLEEYSKAEEVVAYIASRYENDSWYQWCAQTGRGDFEAAYTDRVQRDIKRLPPNAPAILFAESLHLILSEDYETACEKIAEEMEHGGKIDSLYGLVLPLLYDRLGKKKERDKALKAYVEYPGGDSFATMQKLAVAMQKGLKGEKFDQNTIDNVWKTTDPDYHLYWRSYTNAIGGLFLANRGNKKAALECWRIPALYNPNAYHRMMAAVWMRELGENPLTVPGRHFEGQFER